MYICLVLNRRFPSFPGPLYQDEVKCSAFDMEIIFFLHAITTHFHKKGCILGPGADYCLASF